MWFQMCVSMLVSSVGGKDIERGKWVNNPRGVKLYAVGIQSWIDVCRCLIDLFEGVYVCACDLLSHDSQCKDMKFSHQILIETIATSIQGVFVSV